jgi:hypothetical protein
MDQSEAFDAQVARCLHEVAMAAREVPADAQPKRLRDALTNLVALDVRSAGTYLPPLPELGYKPSAGPSS